MATKQTVWAGDTLTQHAVGDLGFVVSLFKHETRSTRHELRGHPARTPAGGETLLYGIVKDSPYTRVEALGLGRVIDVKPNGRALIELLDDKAEVKEGLNTLGYPDMQHEVDARP
jgi:hypothetical protein